MKRGLIAALAAILFTSAIEADTPEARYDAAVAALKIRCRDFCGFGIGSDPAEMKALDLLWDASREATIAFLDSHPSITIAALKSELAKAHPEGRESVLPVEAEELAPGLYGFAAKWGEMGTVFIAGKRGGRFHVLWDARKANPGKYTTLKAWRTQSAQQTCGNKPGCGPLYGFIQALKPDAKGRPRFAIHATYAQMMGLTVGGQLSIWRWDGTGASPLLAGTYSFVLEESGPALKDNSVIAPDHITIRVKDEFKSFATYGSGVGRQLDWKVSILPGRIVDAGKTPLVPELDTIDALLGRLMHAKPADDLASPEAIAALTKALGGREGDSLGYENERTVTATPTGAEICLALEGLPATRFSVEKAAKGFFVRQAAQTGQEACTQLAGK